MTGVHISALACFCCCYFFRSTVVSPKKHDRSAKEFTLLLFLSQNLLNLIEFTLRLEVDIQS
jgi:hypothetical protein